MKTYRFVEFDYDGSVFSSTVCATLEVAKKLARRVIEECVIFEEYGCDNWEDMKEYEDIESLEYFIDEIVCYQMSNSYAIVEAC